MINERENKTGARERESKNKENETEENGKRERRKARESGGEGERAKKRKRGLSFASSHYVSHHSCFLSHSVSPLFISQSILYSLSQILYSSVSLFPTHSFANFCSLLTVFIALNHILIPPPCYNKLRIKNI